MDEPAAPETPAIPPGSPPPQSALDDADVPVADCDWTAFCCDANDKNAFWWTHGGRGVVGRYDVTSGVATAVVTGCNIPFDVACAGGTVCFTERGGIWRGDGVVRSHVPATGTTEILCDQETLPRHLSFVDDDTIVWLSDHTNGTDVLVKCLSLSRWGDGQREPTVLLHRPASRNGTVVAMCIDADHQLVLGLSRGCHDVLGDGVLERYLPVTLFSPERHAQWTYSATSGVFVDHGLAPIRLLCHIVAPPCLFLATKAQVVETYVARHTGSDAVPFRCVASYPHDLLWVACHPSGDVYLLEQGDGCRRVLRVYPCRPPVLEVGEGSRPGGPGATLTSGGIGRMLSRPPPIDLPTGATPAKHPSPLKETLEEGSLTVSPDGRLDASPSHVGVQVILRCRPLLPREVAEGAQSVLTCRRNEVEVAKYAAYVQRKAYLFHRVFSETTQQRQLYRESVLPVVHKALDGYNCTVFAYGQTGTGKTFTLEGDIPQSVRASTQETAARAGIIPRSIHTIFEELEKSQEPYTVMVSHLEIYNEELSDLLEEKSDLEASGKDMKIGKAHSTTAHWKPLKRKGPGPAPHTGTVPSPVLAVSTSPTEASVFAREGSGDVPVLTLPIALHGAAPVTLMAPPPGFNTGTHSLTQALGPPSTASTPAPGAHFPPPLLRSFSSSRSLLNPMPPLHVPPHVSVSPPASFRSPPTPSSIVAPSPRISRRLRIVKDDRRGIVVQGLTEVEVRSANDIFSVLSRSIQRRATFETQMNQFSSRSHSIFTVQITHTTTGEDGSGFTKTGRLNFVDLSGSENLKRSGAEGARQTETFNINRGLLALGRVIKAIVEKRPHVPYRDSKLTRLLEESLGGNSVTVMILTASPCHIDADETVSTLNYANMAKLILNKPQKNEVSVATGEREAGRAAPETAGPGVEEVRYVRPFGGGVPMRARAAVAIPTPVGQLGSFALAPPVVCASRNALDANICGWIGQYVLGTSGALTPEAAACVLAWFRAQDGVSEDDVLPHAGIKALMNTLRRVVMEQAVIMVLAEEETSISDATAPARIGAEACVTLSAVHALKAKARAGALSSDKYTARVAMLTDAFHTKHRLDVEKLSITACALDVDCAVDPAAGVGHTLSASVLLACVAHKARVHPLALSLLLKKIGFEASRTERSDAAVDGVSSHMVRSARMRSTTRLAGSKSRSSLTGLPLAHDVATLTRTMVELPLPPCPESLWSWLGVNVTPDPVHRPALLDSSPLAPLPPYSSLPTLREFFEPPQGPGIRVVRALAKHKA